MSTTTSAAFVLLVVSSRAWASGPSPFEELPNCQSVAGAGTPAKIIGSGHIPIAGLEDCTHFGQCRPVNPYLTSGDQVLVKPGVVQGKVCVRFSDGTGETDGWVSRRAVMPVQLPARWPPAAWSGHWKAYGPSQVLDGSDAEIDLAPATPQIRVAGEAVNGGKLNDHIGDLNGQATPNDNLLVVHDKDEPHCTVNFRLTGYYLDVYDPGGCGPRIGGNFTGLYVKASTTGLRR